MQNMQNMQNIVKTLEVALLFEIDEATFLTGRPLDLICFTFAFQQRAVFPF